MMKNAILGGASFLALAISAPAFGQSAPAQPASVPSPAAPANPTCTSAANNCSTIDQNGSNLAATVTQTGTGNDSDVDQVNGSNGARTTVTQTGTGASSYVLQSNAGISGFPTNATVTQSGDGAESVILQTNTRNHSVRVTQAGDSSSFVAQNGGLDTSAEVLQQGGDANTAIVFQQGGNTSQVGDSVPGNTTVNGAGIPNNSRGGIIQNGSLNTAEVYQGDFTGLGDRARGSRASTTQTGDENDSIIIQNISGPSSGGSASQDVDVIQSGDDNISSVVQAGIRDAQQVDVLQSGNDNLSRVEQSDTADSAPVGGNIVNVMQFGDQNDSFVDQKAATATARVSQTSTGPVFGAPRTDQPDYLGNNASVRANYSRINQTGAGAVDAGVTQSGTGNRSDIAQSTAAGTTAIADVSQNGIFNNSAVRQTAAAIAAVTQAGAYGDNDSFVDQSADGATATVNQFGNNSTNGPNFPSNQSLILQQADADANVTQTGSQNFSAVSQLAGANGASATVVQTTDPAAIGNASPQNESTIVQTALTTAYVEQIGQSNVSRVTQNGAGATTGFATANLEGTAAFVSQKGFNGESTVTQAASGSNNEAVLIQTDLSVNAVSEIEQIGSDNLAVVSQSGSDNFSDVLQESDGNTANVLQTGSNNDSFITQSGGLGGNTATVSQLSDNNLSTVTQGGNGNTATVTQGVVGSGS